MSKTSLTQKPTNGQRETRRARCRAMALEAEDAASWLKHAVAETAQLARYDNRETVDVTAALRALEHLKSLRGPAVVQEFRKYRELDPVRVRGMVAAQRELERRERAALLAGFPAPGGQRTPAALESGPMEASL